MPRGISEILLTEYDCIPPIRDLGVFRHETSMNVWLFVHGLARLGPNLLAVVKEGMCDSRYRDSLVMTAQMIALTLHVIDANDRP